MVRVMDKFMVSVMERFAMTAVLYTGTMMTRSQSWSWAWTVS